MCGIVGVMGDVIPAYEKVFRTLLILDALRGEDSTGMASVTLFNGDIRIAKAVGDPFQLFDTKRFEAAMRPKSKMLLGHNRYATTGAVNARNAHPFDFPSVVGVHNGTIKNKYKYDDANDFDVDSEALYNHIEKNGLKSAIKVSEGAWALAWWDKVEETMNFLRNAERPLFHCGNEEGTAMFFASESWMLYAALNRAGIKHSTPEAFAEDTHYSIHIDNKGTMFKPHLQIVKPEPAVVFPVYHPKHTPVAKAGEEKKPLGESAGSVAGSPSYTNKKDVLLETLSLLTDEHGNNYISCFDKEKPFNNIRLYARYKDPILDMIGEEIYGDITSSVVLPNKQVYYKVSPWTVRIAMTPEKKSYMSVFGEMLDKKSWESVHKACAWCSAPLFAEDKNRFTTERECLCPSCANDVNVLAYVNLN